MLRDRIVWGINDEPTQKKLLQETDLTYAKAVSVAQGFETADKNLKEMHVPKAEATSGSSAGVPVKPEPLHKVSGKRASTNEGGARVACTAMASQAIKLLHADSETVCATNAKGRDT